MKESKGGLRDLNTLFWIGKYVYRAKEAKDLVGAGLFSPEEFALFSRCEEFLWRIRCHMHFIAARAEERLSFDMQRLVAERLKVVGRQGLSGIERFMKRYFLIAKDVGDLTAIVCAAMEARETMPRPLLDRFLGRFRRKRTRALEAPGFAVANGRLTLAKANVFEKDPAQPHPPLLARRQARPRHPSRGQAPRHPFAAADHAHGARGPGSQPPLHARC